LQEQWLYGKEFIEYLSRETIADGPILKKVGEKQGLAQVIIKWFWKRHTSYISIVKELKQKVMTPMQVLNIKVDRIIGEGSLKRAERLQASLDLKLGLLTEIAGAPGLGMPKQLERRLKKQAPALMKQLLADNLKKAAEDKKTGHEAAPKKDGKPEEEAGAVMQKKDKDKKKRKVVTNKDKLILNR